MAHSPARIGLLLNGSIQTIVSRSRSTWRVYAMRSLPALVAAVLVVLGSIAAEVVVSSPFGFLSEVKGAENQLTQGLASSDPTPDSGGGTVVATVPVGNNPFGVGYNSGNGYVYVANWGSDTVTVIDGTTVVATVPVGNNPFGVGYNGGNGYVYVANSGTGNTVSVINGTTVVANVTVGPSPYGVGYNSRNGYVYVANAGSNTVSVISTIGPSSPVLSGLDPAILATILVAIGAVGVAVALIAWKRRKAGRPPPEGAP